MGRVAGRADDDKVVVHHVAPVHAVAGGHEFILHLAGVHQQHVHIAHLAHLHGLAGAHGDHLHRDAGFLLELRQQVFQQAGILGAGGGGHLDFAGLRSGKCRYQHKHGGGGPCTRQDAGKGKASAGHRSFLYYVFENTIATAVMLHGECPNKHRETQGTRLLSGHIAPVNMQGISYDVQV
ncbi:hypothetical protein D3C86_1570320 [compost metagenome]